MSRLSVYHESTPELPNKVLTHLEDIAATLAEQGIRFERWTAQWKELYEEVITTGLCTGCAGCVVTCPHDVIGYEHGFVHGVVDFLQAVATGGPIAPDFSDGVRCLKVLDAGLRSAATGHRVKVD